MHAATAGLALPIRALRPGTTTGCVRRHSLRDHRCQQVDARSVNELWTVSPRRLVVRSARLLLGLLAACASAADGSTYLTDVRPLLDSYCVKCHSPEKHKGDLDLASIKDEEVGRKSIRIWRKVIEKVTSKEMPPEDANK